MHRTRTIAVAVSMMLIMGGTGASAASKTKKKTTTAEPAASKLLSPSKLTAKAPDVFQARYDTSKGPSVLEVHSAWAPNGADRFYTLVNNGSFNTPSFFRCTP